MSTFEWFRFFRAYGNGFCASLRKAIAIRRAPVRVYPIKRGQK
jgi:hypothetical protein